MAIFYQSRFGSPPILLPFAQQLLRILFPSPQFHLRMGISCQGVMMASDDDGERPYVSSSNFPILKEWLGVDHIT